MKIRVTLATIILFVTCSLFGQTTIRVADDSSSGTYAKMLGEMISQCSDDSFTITQVNEGGGAVGNLSALYNNHADVAFLHSDVYMYNAQADPSYNRFKTLVPLWPESIHVLALRVSKTKKSGTFSFGTFSFNTLSDLQGPDFKVVAAGGGVLTARTLSGQGGGGFTVLDAQTGDNVLRTLSSGEADAAIFVGAAPLPNLEKLSGQTYRLIPIGEGITNRVSNVYRPASISGYHNGLAAGPIKTIAPLATLFTKQFSTPDKIHAQTVMRNCIANKLPALQDNGSPNWQDVVANDHGIATIPWLELPSSGAAPVKAPTATRRRP